MSALSVTELLLWALLALLFWRRGFVRRFPAMGAYLGLHAIATPLLLLAYSEISQSSGHHYSSLSYTIYGFSFFLVYLASTILLFFVCLQVFRSALAAFPGLQKFGIVLFRWAALVSAILCLATVTYTHHGIGIVADLAYGLMRSVSILELCLLAFLCLSMNALRLSVRDMAFGIALGLGLMSANEFILSSLIARSSSFTSPLEFVYESFILISLGIWAAYCALPEPSRRPVVMPASSAIYRWNEIASALGHTGTQVAVQQPANGFFLTDVEKVVEKVLTRNLKNRESEL